MEEYEMRIRLLKTKRNSIKREITSLTTFLETYNKGEQFVELQMRSNRLNLVFGNFDQICDEIDALEESDENNTVKDQILTDYFMTSSKAQELIREVLNQNNANEGSVNGSRTSTNSRRRKIKLPPAKIPTFSGGHGNWLPFKHQFMSLVHDDEDLTDKDKFNLLQGACEGDAHKKIKGFLNADTDYTQAWDVLIKAYESKRALISEHLSNILNMPRENTDDWKTLENLIDTARLSMMSLANLEAPQSPELVIKIIEEKLAPETRANWERECERNEFPTFDKLHEFLYKAAALRSMQKSKSLNSKNYHGPPSKIRKTDHKQSASTFVTTTKKCVICSQDYHPLYKCSKFRDLNVYERIKVVEKANLCKNCLRNHGSNECRFGVCKTCGKKHNTLLHIPKPHDHKGNASSEKTENKERA